MHKMAFLFTCFALASRARRAQIATERLPEHSHGRDLTSLAAFLMATSPQSAFTLPRPIANSVGAHHLATKHNALVTSGVNPLARIGPPRMVEYSLNNIPLPGPLQPTGNNLLVRIRRSAQKTGGGLMLYEDEKTQLVKEADVMAVGPGKKDPITGKLLPCPCKVGDIVILDDGQGTESVNYQGVGHLILDADKVLGTFEGGIVEIATFRPLRNSVLIKVAQAAKETASGIAVAQSDESREVTNQGEVIAVGPGRYSSSGDIVPPSVAKGESLMFRTGAGTLITLENTDFRVLSDDSIMAKWS